MNMIPDSHSDLLKDEKRAFLYLGTQMADGSPQSPRSGSIPLAISFW